MRDEIINSLVSTAQYELFTYPHWTLVFRLKNMAKRILKCCPIPNDRLNWPIGIMARGLIEVGDTKTLIKYADSWAKHGARFYNIDDALAAEVFIYLYQETGGEGYKMGADEMYQYLVESRKDAYGSLLYRPSQENEKVAVDMIGLVVPFLVKYGTEFNVPEAIDMAYTQIQNFLINGMDETTGLPVHAYEAVKGEHYGLVGWGRAVGWMMMGMAYFITSVCKSGNDVDVKPEPDESESYEDVKAAFYMLRDRVLKYIGDDGLFSWHITEIDGHVDTSASAMILNAIAMVNEFMKDMVSKPENGDETLEIIYKGMEGLKDKITDGTVTDALGECLDYGIHPQYYGAFPWALGPTLSLLNLMAEREERSETEERSEAEEQDIALRGKK